MIVNAKFGQQARMVDRNPLNLRAGNVFLSGNPETAEGRIGRAKTDSAAFLRGQTALRQTLTGRGLGFPDGEAL